LRCVYAPEKFALPGEEKVKTDLRRSRVVGWTGPAEKRRPSRYAVRPMKPGESTPTLAPHGMKMATWTKKTASPGGR